MFQYLYSLKVSGEIKVRREIVLTRYFNRVAKQRNFRKKRSYLGHTIKEAICNGNVFFRKGYVSRN